MELERSVFLEVQAKSEDALRSFLSHHLTSAGL